MGLLSASLLFHLASPFCHILTYLFLDPCFGLLWASAVPLYILAVVALKWQALLSAQGLLGVGSTQVTSNFYILCSGSVPGNCVGTAAFLSADCPVSKAVQL